jgi:hypothetical protein
VNFHCAYYYLFTLVSASAKRACACRDRGKTTDFTYRTDQLLQSRGCRDGTGQGPPAAFGARSYPWGSRPRPFAFATANGPGGHAKYRKCRFTH